MKKLLLFVFAALAFAACEQAPIEEQSSVLQEAPETITVGFEGDETRIQLNEAQKTVWTKGDLVSVFYKSDANQKYEYRGETGERTAELHKVSAGSSTTKMGYVVVAYPYNEEYIISPASGNLETMLPAVQHYAVDSYGVGDNLMVSCSEFTQFSLKSVCGWLKLQLTGNGEVVKGIKFRGNNGEQVAGLIHVDTKSAEATLYSEEVVPDDNGNANGSLVIDGAMVTEVMLYCDEGVTLSSEATAFYIALPPQTFEEGFTVDVICTDGTLMAKSSDKRLSIERNHIQPMAATEFVASVPNNQIWYTSSDGNVVEPYDTNVFGANIVSNTYANGMGVITFDGDVTTIGYGAFGGCDSLTSVTIPDSVTTIGEYAFAGCDSLTEFKGKFASEDGRSLIVDNTIIAYAKASGTTYTIPDSVTTIGFQAFGGCTSLTSVTIPDSVTTIGDYAFFNSDSLTSVTIGDSVTSIGSYAFSECDSLTSVTIPDSVTTIDRWAFYNCDSLTSVTIGDSVTTIGWETFAYCDSLTSVIIGDSVTSIGGYAFAYCTSLTSVIIGDSVTMIGENAFYGCKSLTSVTIPDSVTMIEWGAFGSCTSLTSVYCYATTPPTLGASVYVFDNNASGRRIYVYEECVEVYKSAWSDYKDSIYTNGQNCPETTTIEYTTNDGNIVTTQNMPVVSNIYDNGVGTLVVVGKITQIPSSAFYNCDSLTSVTIPDSVTTIGKSAFVNCDSLTSVNIPDSVTWIGNSAFSNCTSLTSVNIPDSVTKIGDYAFHYCTSLTSVTIPDSVTTIGESAFYDCDSLTSVTIGDSVTSIGGYAFSECDSLTSVYCKATTPPALGYNAFKYWNGSDYVPYGCDIYVPVGSVNAYKSAEYWSKYSSAIVGYDFENGVVVE